MTSPLSVAADALVAEADSHDAAAIRSMAHEMMATYGCTYDTAKSAVQRAIKRASGEIGTWGGRRDFQPGRPTQFVKTSDIRNARLAQGISQSDLARRIGVTADAVSKWENGTRLPSREHAEKLAEMFAESAEVTE